MRSTTLFFAVFAVFSSAGCADEPTATADASTAGESDFSGLEDDVGAADGTAVEGPQHPAPLYAEATWTGHWQPAQVLKLNQKPVRRGLLDLRGLIHAHSPFSHDACDGEPFDKDGKINRPCWEDFRRDFCTVGHDFVFLTDHPTHFADNEFPAVLLYDEGMGDELVVRDGAAASNRVSCSGRKSLIIAGTESSAAMPVGLPGHISTTIEERKKLYGTRDKPTFAALKAHGAVILYAHTEDRTVSDMVDLPVDGFEMYNLHANMVAKMGDALKLAAKMLDDTKKQPAPDLVILPLMFEDDEYLKRWGSVFAAGVKRVTTMGTDCHRNTMPLKLADGERVDSYRRMMIWFSNHLLVKPKSDGTWDDVDLKDALRKGRLYGAFEFLGYPEGFDFVATHGDATQGDATQGDAAQGNEAIAEMGDEVSVKAEPTLVVRMPTVARVDPAEASKIKLRARLLRAIDGGWEVVAEGAGDLGYKVTKAGAYRAEIRMTPGHLAKHMAYMADETKRELVWIYSNVIYLTP